MPADPAVLFAALGDETRLSLIARLGDGEASIARLTQNSRLTRQAVTKHLYVLEKAGLVSCARLGRETIWALKRQRLEEAKAFLASMSEAWDERLSRLSAHVER